MRALVLSLTLFLLTLNLGPLQAAESADELLAQAEVLLESARLDEASKIFEELVASNEPLTRARALLGRGSVAVERGELAEASTAFGDALELLSNAKESAWAGVAAYQLASSFCAQAKIAECSQAYAKASSFFAALPAGDKASQRWLAVIAFEHGSVLRRLELELAASKLSEARTLFTELGAIKEAAEAAYVLGLVEWDRGADERAALAFGSAYEAYAQVEDKHWMAASQLALAQTRLRQGRPQEALEAFQRSLEQSSGFEDGRQWSLAATLGKGQALLALSRGEDARLAFEEAQSLLAEGHSFDLPVQLGLAQSAASIGDLALAKATYERILANPDSLEDRHKLASHLALAQIARGQGDEETAAKHFEAAKVIDPNLVEPSPSLDLSLARVSTLIEKKSFEQARQVLSTIEDGLSRNMREERIRVELLWARLERAEGNTDAALDRYDDALGLIEKRKDYRAAALLLMDSASLRLASAEQRDAAKDLVKALKYAERSDDAPLLLEVREAYLALLIASDEGKDAIKQLEALVDTLQDGTQAERLLRHRAQLAMMLVDSGAEKKAQDEATLAMETLETLDAAQRVQVQDVEADLRLVLARLSAERGELDKDSLQQAMTLNEELGRSTQLAQCQALMAELSREEGQCEQAVPMYRAALAALPENEVGAVAGVKFGLGLCLAESKDPEAATLLSEAKSGFKAAKMSSKARAASKALRALE
ncbi:MAG: tetratricopeptide repeat protein [Myxococcota bacterium]|jgi:tetratricopeptide (TPR) repeat protein|nr:tetratricopeptide repeat protein [Myxococcota bacterium]